MAGDLSPFVQNILGKIAGKSNTASPTPSSTGAGTMYSGNMSIKDWGADQWSDALVNMGAALNSSTQQKYQTSSLSVAQSVGGNVMKAAQTLGGSSGWMMGAYYAVQIPSQIWMQYKQAKFEKKLLSWQRELNDNQALQYQNAAERALEAGHKQVAAITYAAGQRKASTRVSQAASGVRVAGTGSAAEVMASQDIARDMQVNQTLANAVTTAWGYKRQEAAIKMNSFELKARQEAIHPWAVWINAAMDGGLSVLGSQGAMAMASAFLSKGGASGAPTGAAGSTG